MVAEIILSRYGFAKVRKLARMGGPDYQVAELGNSKNEIGTPSCEEKSWHVCSLDKPRLGLVGRSGSRKPWAGAGQGYLWAGRSQG